MAQNDSRISPSSNDRPRLGIALGSGAALGWAHVGVLKALDELGVEVDVYAGCSVGSLISAAKLIDIWDEFLDWARELGPLDAMSSFSVAMSRGGMINPDKAFLRFKKFDRHIEDLPAAWGAVATDLATGREVWLRSGSVLEACRASSSVPILLQSARYMQGDQEHWMIDGAASNPVPVNLARALGAERVIAVDLTAIPVALSRFDRPDTRAVVPVDQRLEDASNSFAPVTRAIDTARKDLSQWLALAKAKNMAQPHFLETAIASITIIQSHLAEARALIDVADLRLVPDLKGASAAAFDQHESYEAVGYATAMAAKDEIISLAKGAAL